MTPHPLTAAPPSAVDLWTSGLRWVLCVLALALTAPVACFENVSNVELREALDEVVLAGQGQSVENEILEITTDFTLGEAAETIVDTPKGHTIGLGFARVDDDTIAVTLSGGNRERTFHVTSTGQVKDA